MSDPDRATGAVEYHERTGHSPESLRADDFSLDYANEPRPYKIYRDLPRRSMGDRMPAPQVPALAAVAEASRDPTLPGAEPAAPDLGALTALCYYSNGITRRIRRRGREMLFRAAACTGKLYHVDLYVVTGDLPPDGGDPDLSAGVYHFDPRSLSLDVLREGDHRDVLAAASGHPAVAGAPLSFVATSTWWRNAWKYRERTFRHAFWDSGTVLANLLAVAHALDLPASVVTAFADGPVADLVGVDPRREAPLELVPVGGDPGGGGGEGSTDPPDVAPIDPATEPLSPEERAYPLIAEAWRAGTLPGGAAAAGWRARAREAVAGGDPPGIGRRSFGDGPRVDLDPVDAETASARPLANAVRRRGSCREYRRSPVSYRKLSTVLDRSFRGVPADFGSHPLALNDAFVISNAVDGIREGIYHYRPEAGAMERLREGEFREAAGHLALDQKLGADAAACVYFLTDLPAVVDRLGDRGYRAAQLEASVTAGRLYLSAYAHRDLGATGLTFYDDEVTDFLAPRAADLTPTFLLTLGEPA
ncbi:dehydrogenase [Halobacteriales archaeon QS_8_69_26]|nr:MAG: dehydrogenase [Halobacteriales archaeon QS_8_69_26]